MSALRGLSRCGRGSLGLLPSAVPSCQNTQLYAASRSLFPGAALCIDGLSNMSHLGAQSHSTSTAAAAASSLPCWLRALAGPSSAALLSTSAHPRPQAPSKQRIAAAAAFPLLMADRGCSSRGCLHQRGTAARIGHNRHHQHRSPFSSSSSSSGSPPGDSSMHADAVHPEHRDLAPNLLQTSAVVKLREAIEDMAIDRPVVAARELELLCVEKGAAGDEGEAKALIRTLQASGVVLQTGEWVHLKPQDVYEAVSRHVTLPGKPDLLERRITDLEELLAPLRRDKATLELGGNRRGNFVLLAILAGMSAQYATIFRLTYWELSWDVMEPVAYFAQGGSQILCLLYFIFFNTPFEYPAVVEQWKSRYLSKIPFNHEELQRLERELQRHRATVASIRGKQSGAPPGSEA